MTVKHAHQFASSLRLICLLAHARRLGSFNRSPGWQRDDPKIQASTIEGLLQQHAEVKMPSVYVRFSQAQRLSEQAEQGRLEW